MAAKGSIAKTEIFKKMNEDFHNSFLFNGGKELRINWKENGELIQIKVTLTYVKEPVLNAAASEAGQTAAAPTLINDLTEDEKKRLATLVAAAY